MNVLSISHSSIVPYGVPGGYGGAAFHKPTSQLLNYGCDIRVIAPVPIVPFPLMYLSIKWSLYKKIVYYETIDGVHVYHPRYASFSNSPLLIFSGHTMYISCLSLIIKQFRDFDFDIIHAHNAFPDGYAASLLCRKYNVPLVITIRGTDMDVIAKRGISSHHLLKMALSSADTIIAPSPRLNQALLDIFQMESHLIPNGIDLDSVSLRQDAYDNDTYKGKRIILSISMLMKSKGIDLNIKAISALKDKYKNVLYIVVGDGAERKYLEALVDSLRLRDHVVFKGTLTHIDAMKIMALCEVFTMPSWQETFGLVYLEAMAYGKPIIGCDGQGIDNIISSEKIGLLAEPKDWISVYRALDHLLSNPQLCREMGDRGRQLVEKKYNHKSNAYNTLNTYKNVIKNNISNNARRTSL